MPAVARALVVPHDLVMLHRVSDALRQLGFEAAVASSVAGAFDALTDRSYDVVLIDYDMPNIVGLDYLAAFQGAAPTTPRILYAGLVTDELLAEARNFGVFAVLPKPVSVEMLTVTIRAAVGGPARASGKV